MATAASTLSLCRLSQPPKLVTELAVVSNRKSESASTALRCGGTATVDDLKHHGRKPPRGRPSCSISSASTAVARPASRLPVASIALDVAETERVVIKLRIEFRRELESAEVSNWVWRTECIILRSIHRRYMLVMCTKLE